MFTFTNNSEFENWCNIRRATHDVKPIIFNHGPMRVIDIQKTLKNDCNPVVYSYDYVNYSCLSYAWANVDKWHIGKKPWPNEFTYWDVTSMSKNMLITVLTKCESEPLNIKYIWIDALCIDQDSIAEKEHEIPKMKKIYQAAKSVIVLWRNEKEEGMDTFLSPKWITRVWTFQEITMAGWGKSGSKPVYYIVKVNNEELYKIVLALYYSIFVSLEDTKYCHNLVTDIIKQMKLCDTDTGMIEKWKFHCINNSRHKGIRELCCPCIISSNIHKFEKNEYRYLVIDNNKMNKILPLCNIEYHHYNNCSLYNYIYDQSIIYNHWENFGPPSIHKQCLEKHKVLTRLHESHLLSIVDILRTVSTRECTFEEDRVYAGIGLLDIEKINIEYKIGIKKAVQKLAHAMSADQRILLSIIDKEHNNESMLPKMINHNLPWHFNIVKTLCEVYFESNSKMIVKGLKCNIGKLKIEKINNYIDSEKCNDIICKKTNKVIGYGFIEQTDLDIHAIVVGVLDKEEVPSIVSHINIVKLEVSYVVSDLSEIIPNIVVLLCIEKGSELQKVGLAALDIKMYKWLLERFVVL